MSGDPKKIFCECGNMSIAQLADHICEQCEDQYTLCPGCAEREVEE